MRLIVALMHSKSNTDIDWATAQTRRNTRTRGDKRNAIIDARMVAASAPLHNTEARQNARCNKTAVSASSMQQVQPSKWAWTNCATIACASASDKVAVTSKSKQYG
jgi:hypothetical protein